MAPGAAIAFSIYLSIVNAGPALPLAVVLAAAVVFFLTYRDVRVSTEAGVILGIFEIVVFVALSAWMILSNLDHLTLQTFNPAHAAAGTYSGTFKGMVFAILAFIGFESA